MEPGYQQQTLPILLVDDDVPLCGLMADFFAENGLQLDVVHDGPSGLSRALDTSYALVLLDVMLPVLNGFEVLRQLRRRSAVPAIMLTARTEQADRIAALNAGADDYLPKPFGPEELLARIRAVVRRTSEQPGTAGVAQVGRLRTNGQTREAWIDDKPVTTTEFDILDVLVRSNGRVVSRDELSAVLYQRASTPFERSIDVHVSHARKAGKRRRCDTQSAEWDTCWPRERKTSHEIAAWVNPSLVRRDSRTRTG